MRAAAAVLAALAALVGAASPASAARPAEVRTYVHAMAGPMNTWDRFGRSLSQALQDEPTAENGARLTTLGIEFRQLAARTARVHAPAQFRRGHRSVVAALRHTSGTLALIGPAVMQGKPDDAGATLIARSAEANRLQGRIAAWKTAVRAAARRAGVALPRWLR
jgi:hypothetical protein